MCGRIIQASGPLRYQMVEGLDLPDCRLSNMPRRYNGAPSQERLVIRQNHESGEQSLDLLKWGLVPSWSKDPKGGPKPINAVAERARSKPMFRDAYRKRRCIVPVDGFFEWPATKGAKQPYAIAMKNGAPFGLAGLWENWKDPASGEWVRTFTIITVPSNELIARIHDRMPAILRPADYERWLGSEPDPYDLLITFPAEPMKMWPISKRVNNPRNDDEGLLAEIDLAAAS
ncbi:MAG: SOS response-associated peptidase [Methylovirgula sp.]